MSPDNLYYIVSSVFVVVIGYDVINWLRDQRVVAPEIRIARLKSKVHATVLILGVTMVIVSILFHVNILRYASPMPFSEIDGITLKDFKGYRRPYETLDGQKEFAFITTSLSWEKDDNMVSVQSLFHPSRSYVYNDRIVGRSLLRHEMYHFRITEIFARRSRKDLADRKQIPSNEAIDEIVDRNWDAERRMQYRYDDESYHGYIMKEQKRWEIEIDSLLNLLVEYKNPAIRYE